MTALEYGVSIMRAGGAWDDDSKRVLLEKMNAEHAVVSMGSKVRYLHQGTASDGQPDLRFFTETDVGTIYEAVRVQVEEKNPDTGKTKVVYRSAFSLWRYSPERRHYDGIGMFPGEMPTPKGYLNLWKGFAVEPQPGDWLLFREHIRVVICGGEERIFTWLMDWLADIFQNPETKQGSAVVLRSAAKGTGKSMLIGFLMKLLGGHAIRIDKKDQLTGRFNGHLESVLLLGVEEAFWAGDHGAAGALKSLITEPRLAIERKGLDIYTAPNFTRLLFTSNEDWVAPVDPDERRFMVLEVANPRANDKEYFDPIFRQMEKEGGLAAMLHELLNRRITSNLRKPPETTALVGRVQSLDGLNRWVWSVAREGEFPNPEATGPDDKVVTLNEDTTTLIPCGQVIGAAKRAGSTYEGRTVDTQLGTLSDKIGVPVRQPRAFGRRRHYEFPPLPEFRLSVEKVMNVAGYPRQTEGEPFGPDGKTLEEVSQATKTWNAANSR